MMNCPVCDARITVRARFCPECGKNVYSTDFCAVCGSEYEPNAKFCIKCGCAKPQVLPQDFESEDIDWEPFGFDDLFQKSDSCFFDNLGENPPSVFADEDDTESNDSPFNLSGSEENSAEDDDEWLYMEEKSEESDELDEILDESEARGELLRAAINNFHRHKLDDENGPF